MNVRGGRGRGGAEGGAVGSRAGWGGESVDGDESFLCMVVAFREIREKMGETHKTESLPCLGRLWSAANLFFGFLDFGAIL